MKIEIQDGMFIDHGHIWANGLTILPVLEYSPLAGTACQAAAISFPLSLPACLPQDTR